MQADSALPPISDATTTAAVGGTGLRRMTVSASNGATGSAGLAVQGTLAGRKTSSAETLGSGAGGGLSSNAPETRLSPSPASGAPADGKRRMSGAGATAVKSRKTSPLARDLPPLLMSREDKQRSSKRSTGAGATSAKREDAELVLTEDLSTTTTAATTTATESPAGSVEVRAGDADGTDEVKTRDPPREEAVPVKKEKKERRKDEVQGPLIAFDHLDREVALWYSNPKMVGQGAFGTVYKLLVTIEHKDPAITAPNPPQREMALKKVQHDADHKERELHILKQVHHLNVLQINYFFYCVIDSSQELFLNFLFDFMPSDLHRLLHDYRQKNTSVPLIDVKVYVFQLLKGLGYLGQHKVCHRDIKPSNVLVNPMTGQIKIADFGSAKVMVENQPSTVYICSRYYRAPELVFGSVQYTTAVDVWSAGCVFAELLKGSPLFPASTTVDLVVKMVRVLGSPSAEDVICLNKERTDFKFPVLPKQPWDRVIPNVGRDAMHLLDQLLHYRPNERARPYASLLHPFFSELRNAGTTLSSRAGLPAEIFSFTEEEMAAERGLASFLPRSPATYAEAAPEM